MALVMKHYRNLLAVFLYLIAKRVLKLIFWTVFSIWFIPYFIRWRAIDVECHGPPSETKVRPVHWVMMSILCIIPLILIILIIVQIASVLATTIDDTVTVTCSDWKVWLLPGEPPTETITRLQYIFYSLPTGSKVWVRALWMSYISVVQTKGKRDFRF